MKGSHPLNIYISPKISGIILSINHFDQGANRMDTEYLKLVESTLTEWNSQNDEEDYLELQPLKADLQ